MGRISHGESVNIRAAGTKELLNPTVVRSLTLLLIGPPATFFFYFTLRAVLLAVACMSATIVALATLFLTYGRTFSSEERQLMFIGKLKIFALSEISVFVGLDFVLAVLKQTALSVYFIANALAFIVLALGFRGFGLKDKKRINAAATVVFSVFVFLVAYKVKVMMAS